MVLGASRIRLKFLRDIRVKILEPKNFDSNDAISRLFSQIIPEREQDIVRRKTKDIPLGGDIILCTLIHQQNVIDHSFDPLYINFSNDGISGAKGLFFLKILSLLPSSFRSTPPWEWCPAEGWPSGGNVKGGIVTSSFYMFPACKSFMGYWLKAPWLDYRMNFDWLIDWLIFGEVKKDFIDHGMRPRLLSVVKCSDWHIYHIRFAKISVNSYSEFRVGTINELRSFMFC